MKLRSTALLLTVLASLICSFGHVYAAAPLTKIVMTTGSVSEREGGIYVAQEHGFFRK